METRRQIKGERRKDKEKKRRSWYKIYQKSRYFIEIYQKICIFAFFVVPLHAIIYNHKICILKLKHCNKTLKSIIPMKKILHFVFVSILSISAFAADLNPFAYKLSEPIYDARANSVTISYHLNAPATKVRIVIYQDEASPVTYQDFTGSSYTSAGAHTAIVSLHGVPGGYYTYKIDVYGRGQASTVAFHKRTVLNSPFSIDIDNNMNSKWFGRTLVAQPTTNALRGLYEYWPSYFTQGSTPARYYGNSNYYYQGSNSWYYYSHATPLRVRIMQDGSGMIFTTACDIDKDTYLWYVDPENPNNWTSLITASQMSVIVDHPVSSHKIHNVSLDVRKDNENQINLLLLSASIQSGSNNYTTGYIYSGKYVLPKNFPTSKTGEYIHVVDPKMTGGFINPHDYVKSGLLPVAINSSSQFDKYGGYWYCGATQATDKDNDGIAYRDKSAIIHINADRTSLKQNYHEGDQYLKRMYTSSGGFRSNPDFTKVLVANGNDLSGSASKQTARLYNLSQSSLNAHPTLSYITNLGTIFSSDANYITDFAWDHANNIYVVLRNGSSGYGIYTYATQYNAADPFTTKAPNGVTFEVKCYDDVTYSLTTSVNDAKMGTISAGGLKKSCTAVTVTATPKEGYRFVNWTINGVEVNGANPYTLYMTDHMTVCANFASAVYNVTWHNLFKNNEDDKTFISNNKRNEGLWRVCQVEYQNAFGTITDYGMVGDKYKVHHCIGNRANLEVFCDNSDSKMYWLGQYIESIVNKDIGAYYHSSYGYINVWAYYMQAFFNRDVVYNADITLTTSMTGVTNSNYPNVDFIEAGKPAKWRLWWTTNVCKLPETMNYSSSMPIDWKGTNHIPQGSITVGSTTVTPSTWFQWNTPLDGKAFDQSKYLLAWREGSTTGRIVYHVDKPDMKLYATYVDRHISESQDNYDVIRLMQNSKYASNPHTVAVDRKLQAGMYNTICFPFPLDVRTLPNDHRLKGAEVLKFTGIKELYDESGEEVGVLQFESVTQLEAGKPYLIKVNGQNNITEKMYFENVAYDDLTYVGDTLSAELSGGGGLITFHAMISPDDIPAGSVILVSDNRLAKVTTQGQMLGLRGYFTIDDPYVQSLADEGKLYLSIKKPTTTSIPVAPEAEQQKAPKVRKIMQDGHIYIIRGEEVYTVTGHRVK